MVGFAKLVVQTVAVVLYGSPTVQPDWVAIAPILGVAFESNPVHCSGLLCERQQMRTARWCVVPVVPGATVNAKSRNIRSCAMLRIIASLALRQTDVPLFRHGVIPVFFCSCWCWCE